MAEVVNGQHKTLKAICLCPLDDMFQHRLASHRQKRFGAAIGMGPQAAALATGHDHHQVGTLARDQQLIPQVQPNNVPGIVNDR